MSAIKTIAYVGIGPFMRNRLLDRDYMSLFHGGEVLTDLAHAAQKDGFDFVTADMLAEQSSSKPALLLSDTGMGRTRDRSRLISAVCMCLESPIIAASFHHHIRSFAGQFHHLFVWGGVKERLSGTGAHFHPIAWPNTRCAVLPGAPWRERKPLTMVSANKRAFQWAVPRLTSRNGEEFLRACLRGVHHWWIHLVDPWMKSELYVERIRAIQHFAQSDLFDLYGVGWDREVPGFDTEIRPHITRCWRGAIAQGPSKKLEILRQYKFSLCLENTSFPGYITEKIFDCFVAGVVPVYLGAPDILNHVPEGCFIDLRRFRNYIELSEYLSSLSESEANSYLDAARTFLSSPAFERFRSVHFVESILASLREVARSYG